MRNKLLRIRNAHRYLTWKYEHNCRCNKSCKWLVSIPYLLVTQNAIFLKRSHTFRGHAKFESMSIKVGRTHQSINFCGKHKAFNWHLTRQGVNISTALAHFHPLELTFHAVYTCWSPTVQHNTLCKWMECVKRPKINFHKMFWICVRMNGNTALDENCVKLRRFLFLLFSFLYSLHPIILTWKLLFLSQLLNWNWFYIVDIISRKIVSEIIFNEAARN